MVELSIALQTDKPPGQYGEIAKMVESLGFHRISVYNDLLYQPAWPALFEIARNTHSINFGPAAVNPFLQHPIHIAGNSIMLQQITKDRFYLGMARGAWLDFLGVNHPKPILALTEAFRLIEHLEQQRSESISGEFFPYQGGDNLRWKYTPHTTRKMLGSWGIKTIKSCYPYIDEVKLGGSANPDLVGAFRSKLENIRVTLGQEKMIDITMGAVSVVDEDGERARDLARREVALYLPVIAELDPTVTIKTEILDGIAVSAAKFDFEAASNYISDDLLASFAFAGTPQEIIDQSVELIKQGAHCIEFGTPHGITSAKGIELLGKMVLPEVLLFINEVEE